jgi:hypothetical protein
MDYVAINELKKPRVVRERLAAEEELLLTNNGRPVAVLLYVGEADDPEDVLMAARDARSRIALRRVRERARKTGAAKLTVKAIDSLVSTTRQERRKRT